MSGIILIRMDYDDDESLQATFLRFFLYGKFKVHVQSDQFESHLTIFKILKIESNFSVFCKVEIFS